MEQAQRANSDVSSEVSIYLMEITYALSSILNMAKQNLPNFHFNYLQWSMYVNRYDLISITNALHDVLAALRLTYCICFTNGLSDSVVHLMLYAT